MKSVHPVPSPRHAPVPGPRHAPVPGPRPGSWRGLVIDAEVPTREVVVAALRSAGVAVAEASTVERGLGIAVEQRPDLILLDAVLPDGDGVDLCRQLRLAGVDAHIMILSSRSRVELRVQGLMAGADDYLGKPFAVAEVMARARAMLRRRGGSERWGPAAGEDSHPDGRFVVHGDLVVDRPGHRVYRGGVEVHLTRTEWRLLEHFLAHAGETLPKQQILRAVWGEQSTGDLNIVEQYVGYLRQKLDPLGPPLIRTVRLVGYALTAVGEPG